MAAFAFLLLLLAACCHAAWNLIAKRAKGSRQWVFTWAMLIGAVIFAPVVIRAGLSVASFRLAALSAVVETVYFLLLAHAYEEFDLSVVYPLARGTAPLLTAVASSFFLHEGLRFTGVAGILTVSIGI